MGNVKRFTIQVILFFVRVYQLCVSPLMGQHCRFFPSCSEYAKQAILHFGLWQGVVLSLCRVGKCHPWHPGGVDPIPTRGDEI